MNETIELGDRIKDRVSGWEGIATAKFIYLNGCVRWCVSGTDKDGKPEEFVFDEQQIVILTKQAVPSAEHEEPAQASTGGPRGKTPPARR